MTHVAMLIPTIDQIGGAERQVLLLAKTLADRGWRVSLIVLSGNGGDSATKLADEGVEFLSLGMKKAWIDPCGWLRYLRWYRKHKPKIVHSHLPHATWFARGVRLLAPVCVSMDTIHTSKIGSSASCLAYRLSGWLSSHITCVSNAVAEAVLSAGLVHAKKTSIIRNGVELTAAVSKTHLSSRFQWVAVGRLAQVKDYPTLLRAFASLPGQPELIIAGTGPDEAILFQLTHQLSIKDRVTFIGFQQDVLSLLVKADAFVLSSLWEGLPMSLLEAHAAGLPIVATDCAGTREAMMDGETGIVVPIGDWEALGAAMAGLMNMTPSDRQKMGQRGRKFVEQRFVIDVIVDHWESLYRQLLERHPKPTRIG